MLPQSPFLPSIKTTLPAMSSLTPSKSPLARVGAAIDLLTRLMNSLQPPAALLARLYVAQAFFMSGLTKLRDWDTTLALFADEYKVPILPTPVAAFMGTAGEIVLPILLVLGLGWRIPALGLSVVNVVAVISLMEIAPAALQQHITWGVVLAGLAIYGSGPWSLESWWASRKVP
jgi:putative oxidoreductase